MAEPVLAVFDGVATVAVGDALQILWRSGATAPRIRWVNDRAIELIERSPDGIVAAQFLLASATPPGLREVSPVRESLQRVQPRSRRLVVVPLGDAAWQSVVRSVMRAGLALLGQSERIKVASNEGEARTLLGQAASAHTPDEASLEAAYRSLFVALDAPRPTSAAR